MIEVELPDGSIAEFPDGTSNEVIQSVLRKQFGMTDNASAAPVQAQESPQIDQPERGYVGQKADALAGFVAQGLQGALANFGDEIVAAPAALINMGVNNIRGRDVGTFGENYDALRGQANQLLERSSENNPVTSIAANIGGSIASPLARLAGGAASTGGAIARGAGIGALYGAGEGEGIEGRLTELAKQGAVGGALGGVGYKVLDKLLPNNIPTKQELKDAYIQNKNSLKDVVFAPKSIQRALTNPVIDDVSQSVFNITDPSVNSALKDLQQFGKQGASAYRLDEFRGQLGGDKLSSKIRDGLDNFFSSAEVPVQFRDNYRRAMLAGNLEKTVERGSDTAQATRTRIGTMLANSKGISEVERKALKRASTQGLGQYAINIGRIPSAILATATGGNNAASGLGAYLGGSALTALSDRIAKQRIDDAMSVILTGRGPLSLEERAKLIGRIAPSATSALGRLGTENNGKIRIPVKPTIMDE